jgi:hypothetical protein
MEGIFRGKKLIFKVSIDSDFNVKILDTPGKSFVMGIKKYIKTISLYRPASVEDFYRLIAIITRDDQISLKRESFISGCETVALVDFMPIGCYTIRKLATALGAWTIGCYPHIDCLPLTS